MTICNNAFRFTVYLTCYLGFLMTGAIMFSYLESPVEQAMKTRVDDAIQKFLTINPSVSYESLDDLIAEIKLASENGIIATRNVSLTDSKWSFSKSIFFTSTVVTTIGYGHITPLTNYGKIFCILFAAIGIPLTLVLVSALVERLLIPTVFLLRLIHSALQYVIKPLSIRIIHLLILGFIWVTVFLFIPTIIFFHIEPEWSYLDAFYYCFISMTTIGFGDYVPGETVDYPYGYIYKIGTTAYLYAGMTFMMLTLAVFYDIPQLNLGVLVTENFKGNSMEKMKLTNSVHVQYETHSPSKKPVNGISNALTYSYDFEGSSSNLGFEDSYSPQMTWTPGTHKKLLEAVQEAVSQKDRGFRTSV